MYPVVNGLKELIIIDSLIPGPQLKLQRFISISFIFQKFTLLVCWNLYVDLLLQVSKTQGPVGQNLRISVLYHSRMLLIYKSETEEYWLSLKS
jgi:hypothetical protein